MRTAYFSPFTYVNFLVLLVLSCGSYAQPVKPKVLDSRYGNVPLSFELNRGQAPEGVQYLARDARSELLLTADEAILFVNSGSGPRAQAQRLTLKWLAAEHNLRALGEEQQPGLVNYLVGQKSQWLTGIPTYEQVRYHGVYPGIDLVYHANGRALEYDLEIAPGADISRVEMQVDGAALRLNPNGGLGMKIALGEVSWQKPIAFQIIDGTRREVNVDYKLTSDN